MRIGVTIAVTLGVAAPAAVAQIKAPGAEASANVHVLSHVPLGEMFTTGDIEIEQELSRPYVYVARTISEPGFDIISLKNPSQAKRIYSWRIKDKSLHLGIGGSDGHYFKHKGRYYYLPSFQFLQSGPDANLAAAVFDVTGLPDTTGIKVVAEVRTKEMARGFGGFHTLYPYKHSDGRVILFGTAAMTPDALVFDLGRIVDGTPSDQALLGKVPNAPNPLNLGYHDFYVAYDPAARQDKFYGAGLDAGYFVYDVTRPEEPKLLTSITGVAGMQVGHTFQVSPDGRYAVTQMEYQFAPVRIFDLKPGLDGTVKTISRPIGAWAGNWKLASHNHEMRWPYVFVAAFEDGLQVFNMMDPTNPYTVGYYDTHSGSLLRGMAPSAIASGKPREGDEIFNGLWGVDVRNADGLIVASDFRTGFWALKMDGFDGWNGRQWGMPNISSAQDWDNGPDGAPKGQKVSE